jgi:hypothetical protein
MAQVIITYLIIATAFIFAGWKIYKKLKKKKPKKKSDFKSSKITMQHNCSDCAAECILRDAPASYIQNNVEKCNTNYTGKD